MRKINYALNILAKNIANPRSEISACGRRIAKTRVSLSDTARFPMAVAFWMRDSRGGCEPVSGENLY